jgi:hypothetical protein
MEGRADKITGGRPNPRKKSEEWSDLKKQIIW